MCSLPEHSARSAREHEAQAQEPIYVGLAKERGVQWAPPEPAVAERLMICKHCGAEVPFEKTNEHTRSHR